MTGDGIQATRANQVIATSCLERQRLQSPCKCVIFLQVQSPAMSDFTSAASATVKPSELWTLQHLPSRPLSLTHASIETCHSGSGSCKSGAARKTPIQLWRHEPRAKTRRQSMFIMRNLFFFIEMHRFTVTANLRDLLVSNNVLDLVG